MSAEKIPEKIFPRRAAKITLKKIIKILWSFLGTLIHVVPLRYPVQSQGAVEMEIPPKGDFL